MRRWADLIGDRGIRRRGLTLTELLTVAAVLAALGGLVLAWSQQASFGGPADAARSFRCRKGMQTAYMGLRMYLNNYEEYFPAAWHVGGKQVAEDLGNLAFHRFLIHGYCDTKFNRLITAADAERLKGDRQAAAQERFRQDAEFWRCPASGWTSDHFVPEIIFRWPEKAGEPFDKHAEYSPLVKDVASSERPLLADVNASLPNGNATSEDPGHQKEMREGFSTVQGPGVDVFVGAGASLRDPKDPKTGRFDFRHAGEGLPAAPPVPMINVLFLDGHVAAINSRDTARVSRLHARWNRLAPPAGE